ncbi:MAG: hypothetical protein QOE46_1377 [Acidobacteriota bacterium]|nr:hypothetical protein [Acidobacteriota bacterium]
MKPPRFQPGKPSALSAQEQVRKQSHPAIQPKAAIISHKQPVTPPVYRPQPTPRVLQRKAVVQPPATQARTSAPPAYRPQPIPKVSQRKTNGNPQPANQPKRAPVAPQVYRPEPKRILQPKQAIGVSVRKPAQPAPICCPQHGPLQPKLVTTRSAGLQATRPQLPARAPQQVVQAHGLTTHVSGGPIFLRPSRVIQRVKTSSNAWNVGKRVIANLTEIVKSHKGSPQMTGEYPQVEDDFAQSMSHPSEWGEKKSHMEGVNVGALAVMETADGGEGLAFSFNNLGPQQQKMADRMFGLFPEDVRGSGLVKVKSPKMEVIEHAEMQLADSGQVPEGTYIGISKPCCLCCAAALLVQGKYRFGGCHGEAFNQWRIPNFIKNSAENLQKFFGQAVWDYYQSLKVGVSGLPLSMQDDLAHKGDFIQFLETAWGSLQKDLG